ncbi:hypothetical protein OKW96_16515 [Sphingobacterium sp. KU25419]|nr:hypothetical protein OKW96_16515 [Sphingobacterium sp. KU25419]
MPKNQTYFFIALFLLFIRQEAGAQENMSAGEGKWNAYTDFIYNQDKKFFQDIYITGIKDSLVDISLECFYFHPNGDSILVYRNRYKDFQLPKTVTKFSLPYHGPVSVNYIHPSFKQAVQHTGAIPIGKYALHLSLRNGNETLYQGKYIRSLDSVLSPSNLLHRELTGQLDAQGGGNRIKNTAAKKVNDIGRTLDRRMPKTERHFQKKGITSRRSQIGDKETVDLFYQDWYLGRYQLPAQGSFDDQLKQQRDALKNGAAQFKTNNLGDHRSLLSQFRELQKESKENSELTGELSIASNWASAQEEYSAQDNNFYEATGAIDFPIMGIPINLSGYYTTQDRNREAKASYIHFRYDAAKAKEQLLKLVGSYNKKYEQAVAQGGSYDMVYGQFVSGMQTEKDKAMASLKQQLALPEMDLSDYNADRIKERALALGTEQKDKLKDSLQRLISANDTIAGAGDKLQKAEAAKKKIEDRYARALEKYEQIMELERKIDKYRTLMEQYQNASYFDSLMAHDKVKDLKDMEHMSYKDMAKKAGAILPEGKLKGAVTGLTNFDAGMFPKYVSDYTMSGQMLKGADIGYDIGFAEIGATYGKTEYIDRAGNVEGYKAYSGRLMLKPILKQNFGFIYYGYSPGKKIMEDNAFFKGGDVSLPSFRNPVHIVSMTYKGEVTKYAMLEAEFANATKPGQSEEASSTLCFKERSAYNISLTGLIPETQIELTAGYENAGKAFENNTLPLTMAGTERYFIKGKGDFFRAFLTLGLEYNYMVQQNLLSKGNNVRWGFDVATHSKRYPSLYLSYKPFSNFRSFNDTLNIEQKPLLGEVWTGRANYQIKRLSRALRFTLLYNKNNSTMDTVQYGSTLVQFSTIYSQQATMLSLNIGVTKINTDYVAMPFPAFNNSQFMSVAAGGQVTKNMMLNGGTDVARSRIGLSRYGFFLGANYNLGQTGISIRGNFRYSNYKLVEGMGWKPVLSGGLELAWRFRTKLG